MKKSKISIIIIGIAVFVTVIVALIFNITGFSDNGDIINYRKLESRNLSNGVFSSGTVKSKNITQIYTALNGITVDELYTNVGSTVKEKDILCKYNSKEISDNINDIEDEITKISGTLETEMQNAQDKLSSVKLLCDTKLTVANNNIKYYQEKYDSSKSSYNTYKKKVDALPENEKAKSNEYQMMEQNKSSMLKWQRDLENAKLEYDVISTSSKTEIDNAQYNIDKLELQENFNSTENEKKLDTFNKQLSTATLVSPASGVVTAMNVKKGASSDNIIAFEISDSNNLQVVCEIYSDSLLNISENNVAEISFYATDKTINCRGTVTDVVSDSNSSTGFYAIIDIPKECKDLFLGMNVSVFIYTEEKNNALSVAYDEIISDNEGEYVLVARKFSDNSYEIKKVKVNIGIETHYYIEVISNELAEGDYIICNQNNVNAGDIIDSEQLVNIIGAVEK